jgi:hypothetical protein
MVENACSPMVFIGLAPPRKVEEEPKLDWCLQAILKIDLVVDKKARGHPKEKSLQWLIHEYWSAIQSQVG